MILDYDAARDKQTIWQEGYSQGQRDVKDGVVVAMVLCAAIGAMTGIFIVLVGWSFW